MDNNTLLILSNIIYQIYNIEDFEKMKTTILKSIRMVIPNVCGSILMTDDPESGHIFCDPVCYPPQYLELEQKYLSIEDRDYGSWITQRNQPVIIKASSLMPEEERVKTDMYKLSYAPFNVHYSVYLTITSHNKSLGVLTLYRSRSDGDFTGENLFILQLLSEHLNARFYQHSCRQRETFGKARDMGVFIEKYALTEREAEILYLIFSGKSNGEIAESLFISGNTLKKHLQNLYRKTGVSKRTQLLGLLRTAGEKPIL